MNSNNNVNITLYCISILLKSNVITGLVQYAYMFSSNKNKRRPGLHRAPSAERISRF